MKGISNINIPKQESFLSIFSTWKSIVQNVSNYKNLIRELVLVSLISQYKKSFLSITWIFVYPLLNITIWLLLNQAGLFEPGDTTIPYPIFLLLNITFWNLFLGFYEHISKSISSSGKMFFQVKFPYEIIIVEKSLVNIFNFLVSFALVLIVFFIYGIPIRLEALFLPIVLIPLMLFGVSVGMILNMIEVVSIDLYTFLDKIIRFGIYLTPIVYTTDIKVSFLNVIISYNPLTYFISSARDIIIKGELYEPLIFIWHSIIVLLFFLFIVQFFLVSVNKLIEKILE
ncbi:MAG: hypothetical protein AAF363_04610 [Bacteroidota bacterium]